MSYQLEREGPGLRATMRGVVGVDDAVSFVQALAATDPDLDAGHLVIDLTAVDRIDLEIAELHRVAIELRLAYRRGPDFRIACIVPGASVASAVDLFGDVRDLLTGQQAASMSVIRGFADPAAAEAWARGEGPDDGDGG